MIRILLIRHGTTELLGRVLYGRMKNVHLSQAGIEEVRRLSAVLSKRVRLDEVVTSPMERAVDTAGPIAAEHNIEPIQDEGLTEVDFGSWMGKSFTELHAMEEWKKYNRFRSVVTPPGGESILQVQSRAWNALERIVARRGESEQSAIAVVSHGDVIRGLLMLLLGMSVDHIHRLEVAPASVSEINIQDGHGRVRSINETIFD